MRTMKSTSTNGIPVKLIQLQRRNGTLECAARCWAGWRKLRGCEIRPTPGTSAQAQIDPQ
eukprot:3590694-Rhodomonas_salina.2